MSKAKRPKENRKQRLSDTWIARHKLTFQQEDWFDTVRAELILRMSYGGAKTFRVRYKANGKTRTHKLGRWDPDKFNVEVARKAAQKFDPDQHVRPKPGTPGVSEDQAWWFNATFDDVITKYLAEKMPKLVELPDSIKQITDTNARSLMPVEIFISVWRG